MKLFSREQYFLLVSIYLIYYFSYISGFFLSFFLSLAAGSLFKLFYFF
jgi:hypothetical protein